MVLIEHDGRRLLEKEIAADSIASSMMDRSVLNIQDIVTFADIADIEDVKPILDRQIAYNMAIAEESAAIMEPILEKYCFIPMERM